DENQASKQSAHVQLHFVAAFSMLVPLRGAFDLLGLRPAPPLSSSQTCSATAPISLPWRSCFFCYQGSLARCSRCRRTPIGGAAFWPSLCSISASCASALRAPGRDR